MIPAPAGIDVGEERTKAGAGRFRPRTASATNQGLLEYGEYKEIS